MKKIVMIFALAVLMASSAPLFAAEAKDAPKDASTPAAPAKKTVFNNVSNFLDGFDRPMTRRGNKDGFWNATAKWVRNINKE